VSRREERLAFAGGTAPAVLPAPNTRQSSRKGQLGALGDAGAAYTLLLAFTAVLFFRPQDQIPGLEALHLAEVFAIAGIGAMAARRMTRGLAVARFTPEVAGVLALAGMMLLTAPFSIWPGGAVATLTDLFVKVVLIFALAVTVMDTPQRLERLTDLILLASGYIGFLAALDSARGVNITEHDRIVGAVSGMFGNPNDLALHMVSFLPFAILMAGARGRPVRRVAGALMAAFMFGAIVLSKSRAGFLGLVVMIAALVISTQRVRPGIGAAVLAATLIATPFVPESFWQRMASIFDEELDETGSRQARKDLLSEAWQTFLDHPVTGVGAGQFKNYDPQERARAWNEAHNALLQVAAELGVLGLAVFVFLIFRGFSATYAARAAIRRRRRLMRPHMPRDVDDERLQLHAVALGASLTGWLVCAQFASVAYYWTFYYLLALAVVGRDLARERARSLSQ
jgi:O-antigen ligase